MKNAYIFGVWECLLWVILRNLAMLPQANTVLFHLYEHSMSMA